MVRTVAILSLLACIVAPCAAQFRVAMDDQGTIEVYDGNTPLLDGLQVILPAPGWKGGASRADCKGGQIGPGHQITTGIYETEPGIYTGQTPPCARFTVDGKWDGPTARGGRGGLGGVTLTWTIEFTRDLPVECVRLNGTLDARLAAGKGAWFVRKPGSLRVGHFPAMLGQPGGDFSDWGFDWFGWILPGDQGIRFSNPHGFTDMYMQDGRQWQGGIFQLCWTLAEKGTVKKGTVFHCALRLDPLKSADVDPIAKKLGVSLLAANASLKPAASGVDGSIEVRNDGGAAQPVDLLWAVRDDLGTVLRRGEEKLATPALGVATAEVSAPETPSGDYRLHVYARPASGGKPVEAETRLLAQPKGPRSVLDLDGSWDVCAGQPDQTAPPAEAKWGQVPVPSTIAAEPNVHWYRRRFDLPEAMVGKHLRLRFGAVNHAAQVYVNGKLAGEHVGADLPFDVDVTDFAKPGRNELWVRVQNWTAVCTKPPKSFVVGPFENPGWKIPPGTIIAPIGAGFLQTGIWQGVSLVATNRVYIEDTFVQTSVRKHTIQATVTVRNTSPAARTVRVSCDVADSQGTALKLEPQTVTLGAGQGKVVTFRSAWAKPHLWSLDDPHLYRATVNVKQGAALLDTLPTRFGFREVWCDGPRFVLNGVPMKLFATSTWSKDTWDQARQYVLRAKRDGIRIMRLHTQPWQPCILEAADELGLLVVDEAAVYCYAQSYAPQDPRLWKNYAAHLRGLARRDRNHPSLVIYSLENEIISCGADPKVWGPKLGKLADVVRHVDPTRLITCESDLDPAGKMDIIGMHYPHEYWSGFTLYPDKCWWMDSPIKYLGQQYEWRRDKPLYIGEFDGGFMGWYAPYEAFWLGDDAYVNKGRFSAAWTTSLARRQMIAEEVEAYRYYGVTGMCPWFDPDEVDLFGPTAYAPITVALREKTHDFFSGEKVTRTALLYNDSFRPQRLTFRWTAGTHHGSEIVEMKPCTALKRKVSFRAPHVAQRMVMKLWVSISTGGKTMASREQTLSIFPRPAPMKVDRVYLYDDHDPGHKADALLRALRDVLVVDYPLPPPDARVLVIAPGTLKTGHAPWAAELGRFVAAGGTVLCLHQDAYPGKWLPLPVKIDKAHATVICFPRAHGHPILDGITKADLRFWEPDHIVARGSLIKPTRGNFVPIIDSGGIRASINDMNGLNWCEVMELPYGRGRYLLCQLPLVKLLDVEPMAGVLLRKLMAYADTAGRVAPAKVGLVADPASSLKRALDGMRLEYVSLLDTLDADHLKGLSVVIAGGGPQAWKTVRAHASDLAAWCTQGGVLWLNNVTPAETDILRDILGGTIAVRPADVEPMTLATHDPVTMGLSNHELYWRDRPIWDQWTAFRRMMDYEIDNLPAGSVKLTDPPGLVKITCGRGFVLVNQLLWDSSDKDRIDGMKIASILLTNLGARMDLAGFKPVNEADFQPVDLAQWADLGLAGDADGGWMGHGSVMEQFPTGKHILGGVPFSIIPAAANGGKQVIALRGEAKPAYPAQVKGIRLGFKARALDFLQASAWSGPQGAEAAAYVIHYEDGTTQRIPLRVGVEIADWYVDPAPLPYAEVAWQGKAADRPGPIGVYEMRWANPYPDKTLASLDFVSAQGKTVPVLMAVTAEK